MSYHKEFVSFVVNILMTRDITLQFDYAKLNADDYEVFNEIATHVEKKLHIKRTTTDNICSLSTVGDNTVNIVEFSEITGIFYAYIVDFSDVANCTMDFDNVGWDDASIMLGEFVTDHHDGERDLFRIRFEPVFKYELRNEKIEKMQKRLSYLNKTILESRIEIKRITAELDKL